MALFDVVASWVDVRKLLLELVNMGSPLATEALDPNSLQYLGDLFSWSAMVLVQRNRKLPKWPSGLSMPVGFKNGTDGQSGNSN